MAPQLNLKKGFSLIWDDAAMIDWLLPFIAEAGFEGIEPTFNPGKIPSPKNYAKQAPKLKKQCDQLGLIIPSLRAGGRPWTTIPSSDPKERREALEHTRKALECLKLMGGSVLLVVPGQIRADISYDEHWKRVVEYGQKVSAIAEEFDAIIGLENVEARFPISLRDWRDLISEINHPRIRMYLDVGNITWLGLGFPEQWIAALEGLICQVHFKDAEFGGALRNLLAGDVDWPSVMGALRNSGYEGWISVEPVWYQHAPQRLARRLSRDLDAIFAL
jgi:L-ribulose-5-phosphate 3-epimerase